MEIFRSITSNPDIAVGIDELVYDSTQFHPCSVSSDDHETMFDENWLELFAVDGDENMSDDEYNHRRSESKKRQFAFRQEQQRIHDQHLDFKYLLNGLQQIPKLKTVSVPDQFSRQLLAPITRANYLSFRGMMTFAGTSSGKISILH